MVEQKDISPTKLKIAKVAEELFSKKGYAATSMEDITTASGSSKGSIYYHFKSKEKLFIFIIQTKANEWKEEWNKKKELYQTNTEKLYALADHYLTDYHNPLLKAAEEFGGSQTADPEVVAELLQILRNQYYDAYLHIFEDGIKAGEFIEENPTDLMYLLFATHSGLSIAYYEMDFEEIKKLYHKSIEVLLRGIQKK
ncbi:MULTISPECIES: TetR/AcrR family transcriptional regulator [Bacillus]|uniref:TetR/AcrR family transcriptional regulator n=1 Tax=Bacillus TaxID=1386 RepID=UPI0002D945F5|nr:MULTISPECIES: TetR/AcrR family transcriptional regulator [Bacillus]